VQSLTANCNLRHRITGRPAAASIPLLNLGKQFSLRDTSRIVLAGGVQWNNVLFNIRGRAGAVALSGNSSFAGILMANRRTVQVADGAGLTGEVIANRFVIKTTSFTETRTVAHPYHR
jgi:Ice-binding-like